MKKQALLFNLTIIFLFSFCLNTITAQNKIEVLIPLYMYPDYWDENDKIDIYQWPWVADAQKKVNISAIINPKDGPELLVDKYDYDGDKDSTELIANSSYIDGILDLNKKGLKVYAYIKTGWMGNIKNNSHPYKGKPSSEIYNLAVSDLKTYRDYYQIKGAKIDGIFFDEVNTSGVKDTLDMYKKLYEEVAKTNPEWKVILNPGTDYQVSNIEPYGDIIVSYEKSMPSPPPSTSIDNFLPAGKNKFAAMVYNIPKNNATRANEIIDDAINKKYGYVFVTDDVYVNQDSDNPYNNKPGFWGTTIDHILNKNKTYAWTKLSSKKGKEISWGGDEVFLFDESNVNGGHRIFYAKDNLGNAWQEKGGAAVKIDVNDKGKPWVVNSNDDLFRTESNGNWKFLPSKKATDVAVGGGNIYILDNIPVNGGHRIYYSEDAGNTWTEKGGAAIRVAVDHNGDPWLVNSNNDIFKTDENGGWKYLPGMKAREIACGNGKVFIIGNDSSTDDYGIYQWKGGSNWFKWSGAATKITVDKNGQPWVVNSNGEIFR